MATRKKTSSAKSSPKPTAAARAPEVAPPPPPAAPFAGVRSTAHAAYHPASADEPTVELGETVPRGSEPPAHVLRFAGGADDEAARRERDAVVVRPGTLVRVTYGRSAADLEERAEIARIEVGYLFDGGEAVMAVVADGQRDRQGELVRRTPTIRVPADARRELQVWFRVELRDGRTTWDSAWGRNYRFPVVP